AHGSRAPEPAGVADHRARAAASASLSPTQLAPLSSASGVLPRAERLACRARVRERDPWAFTRESDVRDQIAQSYRRAHRVDLNSGRTTTRYHERHAAGNENARRQDAEIGRASCRERV